MKRKKRSLALGAASRVCHAILPGLISFSLGPHRVDMPDQITVRRCATQDEAEVFNRILSWNDIASKVVADSKTGEFHVQVNTEKEQAADAALKVTDNRP